MSSSHHALPDLRARRGRSTDTDNWYVCQYVKFVMELQPKEAAAGDQAVELAFVDCEQMVLLISRPPRLI